MRAVETLLPASAAFFVSEIAGLAQQYPAARERRLAADAAEASDSFWRLHQCYCF